jgi:hypothetical protein
LAEPKLLGLSSSSGPSQGLLVLVDILGCTATTLESSKHGEITGARANPPMEYSVESTPFSTNSITPSPYTQLMFPVNPTRQMLLPEASTPLSTYSYPRSHSHLISTGSLLIPRSPSVLPNSVYSDKETPPPPSARDPLTSLSMTIVPLARASLQHLTFSIPTPSTISPDPLSRPRFFATLNATPTALIRVHSYLPSLTPATTQLRPHCPARDRLCLWKPAFSRSPLSTHPPTPELTESDLDRVITVINTSWQPSTRETYRAGLLVFMCSVI